MQSIINGLLYDTKKAELWALCYDERAMGKVLYKTKNGRFFRHDRHLGRISPMSEEEVKEELEECASRRIKHHESRGRDLPMSEEEVKVMLGEIFPERYIELFGEVEDA